MRTVTYLEVKQLTAELADRTRDNLPPAEATMLLAFWAGRLPDLWNREAWPELCDNLEAVTLDANACFSKRLGAANEMGDILAVLDGNPLTSTQVAAVKGWEDYGDSVHVVAASAVWVDWQDPCPDLLDSGTVGSDINVYTLPERFKLPLAYLGAAFLLGPEDDARARQYQGEAELILARQAARIKVPWWRRLVAPG